MRKQLNRSTWFAAFGACALAAHAAQAMNGPQVMSIDGGPLGSLNLSGGVDGYGYLVNNVPKGPLNGVNVGNALVQLQKASGILQFTIEIGSNGGAIPLGTGKPQQTSINQFSTGPLFAGYITISPPDMPFSISAGQVASLEGYEAGVDWYNASQLSTDIFAVENSQNRAVEFAYDHGPVSTTVSFGDGYDTGVFNFLQALVTYTFNSSNVINVFYGGNLGRTGLNAKTYGNVCGYGKASCNATVGTYGPYFANSQMFGAYYSYTNGNLNIVPEVQYIYAKKDHQLGLNQFSSNLGLALFGDYSFADTPYSIGGWVEYENSIGPDAWFVGPKSEGVGLAVSPTWQYKDLFARANAGYFYLFHNSFGGVKYGYGSSGTARGQFVGTLEAGVLF